MRVDRLSRRNHNLALILKNGLAVLVGADGAHVHDAGLVPPRAFFETFVRERSVSPGYTGFRKVTS